MCQLQLPPSRFANPLDQRVLTKKIISFLCWCQSPQNVEGRRPCASGLTPSLRRKLAYSSVVLYSSLSPKIRHFANVIIAIVYIGPSCAMMYLARLLFYGTSLCPARSRSFGAAFILCIAAYEVTIVTNCANYHPYVTGD